MKQSLIFLIFNSILLKLNAQSELNIDCPCIAHILYKEKSIVIDSIDQIPLNVSLRVNDILRSSMTDFVSHLTFITGYIIELEKGTGKDPSNSVKSDYIIPKYRLIYKLCDTNIGISSYCIELSLDSSGQITKFDWPLKKYNRRDSFFNVHSLQKTASDYVLKKKFKNKIFTTSIILNHKNESLNWCFSFLQKSSGKKTKKLYYLDIEIDPLKNEVIDEKESISLIIKTKGISYCLHGNL